MASLCTASITNKADGFEPQNIMKCSDLILDRVTLGRMPGLEILPMLLNAVVIRPVLTPLANVPSILQFMIRTTFLL